MEEFLLFEDEIRGAFLSDEEFGKEGVSVGSRISIDPSLIDSDLSLSITNSKRPKGGPGGPVVKLNYGPEAQVVALSKDRVGILTTVRESPEG